jgi:hypothetical protein
MLTESSATSLYGDSPSIWQQLQVSGAGHVEVEIRGSAGLVPGHGRPRTYL